MNRRAADPPQSNHRGHRACLSLIIALSLMAMLAAPTRASASVRAVTLEASEEVDAARAFRLEVLSRSAAGVRFRLTAREGGLAGIDASLGTTASEAKRLEWEEVGSDPLVVEFEVEAAELASMTLFVMEDQGLVGTQYALPLEAWSRALR